MLKDNKHSINRAASAMFESHEFENPVITGQGPNPYSANRIVGQSADRQIERLGSESFLTEESTPSIREYSPEEAIAMRSVKSGLQCYYSGIYLVTLCFFISGFLGRAIGAQAATWVSLGTTLGILVVLYGEIRCLAIPRETGGFRHILLSVAFYSLGVTLFIFKKILAANGQAMPAVVVPISFLQLMVGFLANYFFLSFIICLTRFMNNRALYIKAVKTRTAIWSMVGFVCIVILVAMITLNQAPANGRQLIFVIFGVSVLGFIILVYSWLNRFTRLVQETCDAINLNNPEVDDPLSI